MASHSSSYRERRQTMTFDPAVVAEAVGKTVRKQVAKGVIARCLTGDAPQLQVRRATSEADLYSAYALLYREYRKRELCDENEAKMHFNRYSLLPNTRTYLMEWYGRVAGTVTLVEDSPYGIPLEQTYPDEVAEFRRHNLSIGEVGALALDNRIFSLKEGCCSRKFKIRALMTLFYAMFKDARDNSPVTNFLIVVHPRHERIYLPLGYTRFAEVRSYGGACGKPAVPLHNSVSNIDREMAKMGCHGLDSSLTAVDSPFSADEEMIEHMYNLRPEVFKARVHNENIH